ncbi:MAG: LEPR-XLL domain-containing protein, partial [Betaproteobacteria bacterium]
MGARPDHSRQHRARSQRGWIGNPLPSSLRLLDRMVARAMRAFADTAPRKALFESLEPRMLLSADPLPGLTDDPAARTLDTVDASASASEAQPLALMPAAPSPGVTVALDQGVASQAPTDVSTSPAAGRSAVPSAAELDALLAEALARMDYAGAVRVELVDLSGPYLARAAGELIRVDVDAAGYGWFVDSTPADDAEFAFDDSRRERVARAGSPAAGGVDLLSVLMHEIGHLRGDEHAGEGADPSDVMQADFGTGLRRQYAGTGMAHAGIQQGERPDRSSSAQAASAIASALGEALTITPTVTWIGNDGFWDVGANWSTGIAPGIDDDVLIDRAGATNVITVRSNVAVRSLLSNENIVLQSGSLSLSADSEINGAFTMAAGSFGGTGAVALTGAFNVSGSSALAGTGALTTLGTSTINIASANGNLSLTGGKQWVNEGTLTIGGDDTLLFGLSSGGNNTLINAVGATLNLSSTHATPLSFWTGTATLDNAGILNQTVGGTHSIASSIGFNNTGQVSVDAGTLVVAGGGTDSGGYAVGEGATLTFSGGTRNLGAGSNVTGLGRLTVSGGTVNTGGLLGTALSMSGGTLNVNTAAAVTLPSLAMSGGTLGGTGAVVVSGAFGVTGSGTLSGTGTFTTEALSTVNIAGGGGNLNLTGGKHWINEGVLTIGSDDTLLFGLSSGGSNTLTNAVGATLNLSSTHASPLGFWTGTAALNNAGTLNQTLTGAHTIASSIAFSNTGTVNLDAGTLTIAGGGTDSGDYAVAEGAVLAFSGGTRTLGTDTSVTGLGRLTVSGATVHANGVLALASTGAGLTVSSGTLNLNADSASGVLAPVTLSGGTLNVNTANGVTLPSLAMSGGTLGGTGAVVVSGAFGVTGSGTLSGTGTLTTEALSTVNIAGGGGNLNLTGGKHWINEGVLTIG